MTCSIVPFNCLLYILPIIYTTYLLFRVQIELQNIPRSAFPLSTDRLHLFLNLLLLQVLPIFPPDYKSNFRPSTNHISAQIQIIFLPKYKSFLSAASQALTRAPAKGPDPCSKSKYGRLKLRDWSWICEKTNWDLWRAERRICDEVKGRPWCQIHSDWFLSSKFESTINDSQLSILWWAAYFHKKKKKKMEVLVGSLLQSARPMRGHFQKNICSVSPFPQFGNPDQLNPLLCFQMRLILSF